MKIQKFIWIMIITFMIINSNLNCQYDKIIDSKIYNNRNLEYTYSMINYDFVRIAVKKYDSTNQKRFKDIFIKNHLENFIDENEDFCDEQNLSENLDSLRIKTIPRFKICLNGVAPITINYFQLDTNELPERIFVFYKQILLGYYFFIDQSDYPNESKFKSILKSQLTYKNHYESLSSNELLIDICGFTKIILAKKHNEEYIIDFTQYGLYQVGVEKDYYISEKTLLERIWEYRLERSCDCNGKRNFGDGPEFE